MDVTRTPLHSKMTKVLREEEHLQTVLLPSNFQTYQCPKNPSRVLEKPFLRKSLTHQERSQNKGRMRHTVTVLI